MGAKLVNVDPDTVSTVGELEVTVTVEVVNSVQESRGIKEDTGELEGKILEGAGLETGRLEETYTVLGLNELGVKLEVVEAIEDGREEKGLIDGVELELGAGVELDGGSVLDESLPSSGNTIWSLE